MKPILTKEENVNLYLKNFMQLGEALMNAGGNSFSILKKYDEFLRTLAANNIEVTAKYNSPEDDLQKLVKEDPMWQNPLGSSNTITNTTSEEKPNTFEVYPSEILSSEDRPKYFLEIYNGERWKLCLRAELNFSVPKFGWSSEEGHPYTLGDGEFASDGLMSMYSVHNLKRIVDGLNMQDTKESSPLPPTSFEPLRTNNPNWQKNYPYPITTSP